VAATERLVLFPTWLLRDLLGVVMLSTFGYEHKGLLKCLDVGAKAKVMKKFVEYYPFITKS